MRVFMFRLSLKGRQQRDVFERKKDDGTSFSREEWLRNAFSKQFSFTHRSNELFFVPEKPDEVGIQKQFIVGWIARDSSIKGRTPPWEGFSSTERDIWQAALLLIDPRDHEDGQKVAFESHAKVGKPDSVLASLVTSLSDRGPEEPYSVSIFPIIEARSFARFAAEHKGTIKLITYDVAVPNMFNSPDDFSEEMRRLRDKGNVARVRTSLESDGSINTEGSQLDEIAEHVEKGGGKITARTNDGKRYNSDDYKVSEEIDINGTEPEAPGFWERIKQSLDRIF